MEDRSILLFLTFSALLCELAHCVTVTTSVGDILGTELTWKGKTVRKFFGVPFAEAPVGDLRFSPPVPKAPFTEPFNGEKIGAVCLQNQEWLDKFAELASTFLDETSVTRMSEDCLNLNIWAPMGGEEKKAVMIWIHGGGFTFGAGMQYNATKLALFGDVIVVTINYRLGLFGFFSTLDENAVGNFGLMDQQLAFKWVQENIGAFGGDKDRVTIFGESAGSASVTWQMLVPSNKGLFQRAIAESGTSFSSWAVADPKVAKKYTSVLAAKVNCSNDDSKQVAACLRALPAEVFKYNTSQSYPFSEEMFGEGIPAGPRADGEFIPYLPTATAQNKRLQDQPLFRSVDFIIGANRFEGSPIMHIGLEPMYKAQTNKSLYDAGVPKDIVAAAWAMLGKKPDQAQLDAVWWLYATSVNGNSKDLMSVIECLEFIGDFMFYDGTVRVLKGRVAESSEKTGSTYQYSFLPEPSKDVGSLSILLGKEPGVNGAGHGDEVGYLFAGPPLVNFEEKFPKADVDLSNALITYWSNFAKSGNPNEPVTVPAQWPQYEKDEEKFFELDKTDDRMDLRVSAHFRNRYLSFWREVMPSVSNQGSESTGTKDKPDHSKTENDAREVKDEL